MVAGVFHRTNVSREILYLICNSDSLILRNEERTYGLESLTQQRNYASIFRNLSELGQFSQAGKQPGMAKKPFTSANLSKTLSLCFIHQGPFLILIIFGHAEGEIKRVFS